MDTFRNYIEKYTHFTEQEWKIIQQAFIRKEIKKDEIIVEEGKICRNFYFLEKGLIRFFTYREGNDFTKTFTLPPYCFTSTLSFRNQKPAEESIQALEDSVVWETTYNKMNELSKINSWNTFIRKLVNEVQEFSESFLMEIRTETAEKRYEKLLENYSDIIPKIPLKYLSSFLGIAPQSLSRIRKKLNKNNKT